MAKKKEIKEVKLPTYIPWTLEDIMSDRFGRYSKYIIQERALPDARDGLKPVQRRILYAMHHDGNTYDKAHRKSAKTVGLVIGNYHPHGDTSEYDAMVRLSQDWKIREPLIDMHGNNGSIDDDPAAAMRYTEARLSKISSTMCEDLDKETVLLAPNFDDTEMEPTVLPARFPMLLVNGCTGIAAGYATNMAPHNLNEVVDATIHRINHPNCSLETLMGILKGPDFPTGGIVMGKAGLMDAYRTGKGKVLVRAKAEIVDSKTCRQIVITEIPYEVVKCQLVKKMDEISKMIDVHIYTGRLVLYIGMSKQLKEYYREAGIDESVWRSSMMDLKYKLLECKEVYNLWGVFTTWFDGFFRMTRFALGRLQFDMATFGRYYNKNGVNLTPESHVLGVHIPRTMTKLDRQSVKQSYARASEFFRDWVGDNKTVFICGSWLLFPRHRELLSAESNILAFMNDFDVIDSGLYENYHEIWRLFDRNYTPELDKLPQDSTLRRTYVDLIRSGEKTGWGFGVYVYNK